MTALSDWLSNQVKALASLAKLDAASTLPVAGPDLRALLIRLVDHGGMIDRLESGIDRLDKAQRHRLTRLGVRVGTLDLFVPQMLRPQPLALWRELGALGANRRTVPAPAAGMPPVLAAGPVPSPPGYRRIGRQDIRLDMAEKLLREAHAARIVAGRKGCTIDPAMAVSMGLTPASHAQLLRLGGFRQRPPRPLGEGMYGPPAPLTWQWRPPRRVQPDADRPAPPAPSGSAFAALAELVR